MNKLWHFYNDDELLTTAEQKTQQRQQDMSIGFWFGFGTMLIIYLIVIIFAI